MQELIICGAIDPSRSGEWFPAFNDFICREYLQRNFKLTYVQESKPQSNDYYVQQIGRIIHINANNLVIVNPRNHKVIIFTTYWNLEHLYDNNCGLFNHHVVKCFSGHFNSIETQFLENKLSLHDIFAPWLFRPLYWSEPSSQRYKPSIEKLFFNGLQIRMCRDFVKILHDKNLDYFDIVSSTDPQHKIPTENYYEHCSQYRVCLSASGVRDMCNRDIEFFKMGIPMIRSRFTAKLMVDIPDEVYLPVECDIFGDSNPYFAGIASNPNQLANNILEKFQQVIDDHVLLKNIGENARDFYQDNFTPEKIAQQTMFLFDSVDNFFD